MELMEERQSKNVLRRLCKWAWLTERQHKKRGWIIKDVEIPEVREESLQMSTD